MSPQDGEYTREGLAGVLEHFNWVLAASAPGAFDVWSDPESAGEILLPTNREAPDFEGLLRHAHNTLTLQYGFEAREILARTRFAVAGSLRTARWRKATPFDAGAIGWQEGEALISDARSQLAAAAKSTLEPRRYHGNSGAFIAREFLAGALMGQTDVGSFIINALVPVEREFFISKAAAERTARAPGILHHQADVVSGLEVLTTFERATSATRDVLDAYRSQPRDELFGEASQEGVSFEFVRALANSLSTGDLQIEVLGGESTNENRARVTVEFESVDLVPLSRAASYLVQTKPSQRATVTGHVTLLSRDDREAKRVVRLQVTGGADAKVIRVRLDGDQYDLALTAHQERRAITVTGELERDGKYFWLYGARGMSVGDETQPTTLSHPDLLQQLEDDEDAP